MKKPWKTEYDAEKHPDTLFAAMSRGKTPAQCAKLCQITLDMLDAWTKDRNKPEFMEAHKAGQTYFRAFWEDFVYESITGDQQCSTTQEKLLSLMLKTQLTDVWNEKALDMTGSIDEVSRLGDEEIDARIKAAIAKDRENEL